MNQGTSYPAHQATDRARNEAAGLLQYARIVYRRRTAAIIAFLVVFLGTALWTLLATPVFEASSTVQVLEEGGQDTLLSDLAKLGKGSPVAAEMEIIRSRSVAEGVVRELGLDVRILPNGDTVATLKTLEVPFANLARPYEIRFTDDSGSMDVYDPDGNKIGSANAVKPFELDGFRIELAEVQASRGDILRVVRLPLEQAAWEVQYDTRVRQVGDKTNIISVSYSSEDPQMAADVVNALVDIYRRKNIEQKSAEASQTMNFITNQLSVVEAQLEQSEDDLQRFKSEHGVMLLSQETEALIENLARFERQLYEVGLRKRDVQQVLDHLQSGRRSQALTLLPAVQSEDVVLSTHGIQLAELVQKREGLLAALTEDHPEVRAVQAHIDQIQDNIEAVLRSSLRNLVQREDSLQAVVDEYILKLSSLPKTERDLAALARTRQVNEEIYTFLLQKHEEARIAKAATVGNIRVIDRAIVPTVPVRPKTKLNLLLGLIIGLLAALGAAFLLEFVDDSIRSTEEIERICRKPIYGIIPRITRDHETEAGPSPVLVTHLSPKSPTSEAFRSLRTNLQFGSLDRKLRTILITSAGPGEGKSTISSNLAVTLAAAGNKVLLIDADLRKPTLDKIFGLSREQGLTSVLTSEKQWKDVVAQTGIDGLDLLPSGPIPPNPTEVMSSKVMSDLLNQLLEDYEMIIFDSPPVVAVTDAAILGAILDATLLVVELGRAKIEGVRRAMHLLTTVGANLLGIVANNITMDTQGHYGYYYYYYDEQGSKKRRKRQAKDRE